ncbi:MULTISPECIES: alpha-E domain-containing protein [unclassified Planococcus (in: firmicutes)]|uniref:alpha-E domain-containing protein n=1 Tax=unclassified Planococcus (in: firmicutes) TaxID=2662419 RepID=UPI000C7DA594|nr:MULTISPECIES: alpha-E domain-containing protein [unclassified Planococcus (in: firmicutes)]PKG45168.1 protein containing transglutaminase-like domain, cysteine protease [Planococcus sp. Urea-trap-24]PKG87510.1 protein containing transglutaminase-like domain, cysteine protease [Planococcus sp. Urea-3u-39]PKH42635.1 protein containing transglutaminase-like domain, cysteine protease [Planococcus sp. MB-3u-09]
MLSRVANSLYWMSRNVERAENNARILDVQLLQMIEAADEELVRDSDWRLIFEICDSTETMRRIKANPTYEESELVQYLAMAQENSNSVASCTMVVRENARISRDHIPDDYWETWNRAYLSLTDMDLKNSSVRDMRSFLENVKTTSLISQGIVESSMSRGVAYQMIKIAKWLERAEKTARILNVVCERTRERVRKEKTDDYYFWLAALRMTNGYNAYLKSNPPRMEPKNVLAFLISDKTFPRSIRYCLDHVRDAVEELEGGKVSHYSWELYAKLDEVRTSFSETDIESLDSDELMHFLNRFQDGCNEISRIFSSTYYLTDPEAETAMAFQSQGMDMKGITSMKYKIEHTNIFDYETIVDQSMNTIRLKPRTDECQRLLSYRADITPATLTTNHVDIFGNNVETFFIAEHHQHLEVKATSIVSIQKSPFIHRIDYSPEMNVIFHSQLFAEHYMAYLSNTAYTYMLPEQMELVDRELGDMSNPVQYSIDVMEYLFDHFTYDGDSTTVTTTASESFNLKKGVCQDITHVMLGILRSKNIPARYVSGYLYVGEDSALVGDAASHAWVEVMVPGIGWVGLDPTNNVEALENHIRVGTGRDYNDVSPVQGVYRGGSQSLDVKVSVSLLDQ